MPSCENHHHSCKAKKNVYHLIHECTKTSNKLTSSSIDEKRVRRVPQEVHPIFPKDVESERFRAHHHPSYNFLKIIIEKYTSEIIKSS